MDSAEGWVDSDEQEREHGGWYGGILGDGRGTLTCRQHPVDVGIWKLEYSV